MFLNVDYHDGELNVVHKQSRFPRIPLRAVLTLECATLGICHFPCRIGGDGNHHRQHAYYTETATGTESGRLKEVRRST